MLFFKQKNKINDHSRNFYLVSNALIMLATFMLVPIYALFITDLGGTVLHASITAGVFYLVASIFALIFGRMIDKLKHDRSFLILGYVIIATGYLLLLFATSFWHIILIQVYLGIADALIYPAFDSIFVRHINKKYEHAEWGALESTRYLTMFTGAILGGVIVNYSSFQILFIVMIGICLASLVNVVLMPKQIR
jgi:MFS family permease